MDYLCSIIGYFCKILWLRIRCFFYVNVFENLPVNSFILSEINYEAGGFVFDVTKEPIF